MGVTKSNILLQYSLNGVNLIGLCISIYTLVVELHQDAHPEYKPFCDISESVNCSKSLMSKWGKGFGIVGQIFGDDHPLNLRNPVFGIAFFIVTSILTMSNSYVASKLLLWLTIVSNFGSVYLAYIMYVYIKSLCIVCCSLYLVNFVLLLLAYQRLSVIKQLARKKRA